jgi:chromatin remodeling complex protein RSC6
MKTLDIATYLSILDSPIYFDMRLLPDSIKEKINKKFDLLKQKFFFTSDQEENINRNIDYLNKSIENKDKLLKQFKAFNNQVDSLNKTSFIKIYPELADWYEKI